MTSPLQTPQTSPSLYPHFPKYIYLLPPSSTSYSRKMRFNALIRTHHITSRKKVSNLKDAADAHHCFVLLRSGGVPGIMYVEGVQQDDVEGWVSVVRNLRYKDFQLVTRPQEVTEEHPGSGQEGKGAVGNGRGKESNQGKGKKKKQEGEDGIRVGLEEVDSVKEFGSAMAQRGVWQWWRKGMGYVS